MTKTLHLIPVGLGEAPTSSWLPADAQALASRLTCYIAENAKTARAFLKLIGTQSPLQEITIHTLGAKTSAGEINQWLNDAGPNSEIGLVSEAGCPAVADPGAKVVMAAHKMGIRVIPWVGPSSILLGLMASGLDGQRFTFHGYAPVNPTERGKQLKAWEAQSAKLQQTQLFIETPYRNAAMFESLLNALRPDTRLCITRSVTTQEEWIKTKTIAQWKAGPAPELDKKPTLFLFLAS